MASVPSYPPRWGAAAVFIPSPPSLLLHGGKTDSKSGQSYSSAPNTADLLLIPLDSPFENDVPLQIINSSGSPATAWHSLSIVSVAGGTSPMYDLLLLGGDVGTTGSSSSTDSSYILNFNPSNSTAYVSQQPARWTSQPARRIHHAATSGSEAVYITGGQKPDGSGAVLDEVYRFTGAGGFERLPGLPRSVFHHVSVLLPNGTLLVLAGAGTSPETGNTALLPLSTIYRLDVTAATPVWSTVTLQTLSPTGRRGAAAALIEDGYTLFLTGGADASLQQVFADSWTLDLTTLVWTPVGSLNAPGGRYDQAALAVGRDMVIVTGGYAANGPAGGDLFIYNAEADRWSTSWEPSSISTGGPPAQQGSLVSNRPEGGRPTGPYVGASIPPSASTGPSGVSRPGQTTSTVVGGPSDPSGSSPTYPFANKPGLTSSETVGIVLGILAVLSTLIVASVLCHRRRKKRVAAAAARDWDFERRAMIENRGLAKPYGSDPGSHRRRSDGPSALPGTSSEKQMASSPPPPLPAKTAGLIGLGLRGLESAGLASLQRISSMRSASRAQRYAQLHDQSGNDDDDDNNETITRMPTKREGQGIRLLGPRGPHGPPRSQVVSPPLPGPRKDMLGDEDSRVFANVTPGRSERSGESSAAATSSRKPGWRSARDILKKRRVVSTSSSTGQSDSESLVPPQRIRGGPVPTPEDSVVDFDPFSDTAHPAADTPPRTPTSEARRASVLAERDLGEGHNGVYELPMLDTVPLDFGPLLTPSASSRNSLLPSERKRVSKAPSDMEEGVVAIAHKASHHVPSLLSSPDRSAESPGVRRSESFFKRMAQGGITGLLSSVGSSSATQRQSHGGFANIRDPTPAPDLWPIISRDDVTEAPEPVTPLQPRRTDTFGHERNEVSLSSLQSARTMRDMVVVQRDREVSDGTVSHEGVLGWWGAAEARRSDDDLLGDGLVPSPTHSDLSDEHDDRRESLLSVSANSPKTPTQSVRQADDAAPPTVLIGPVTPERSSSGHETSGSSPHWSIRTGASTRTFGPTSASTPKDASALTVPAGEEPASVSGDSRQINKRGSPLPEQVVAHRRPVKDMVSSINKRSSLPVPRRPASTRDDRLRSSVSSCASSYDQSSSIGAGNGVEASGAASGRRKRPATLYEAVKRGQLTVANPDGSSRGEPSGDA